MIDFAAYAEDSRGGTLERFEMRLGTRHGGILYLRGPATAAHQIGVSFKSRGLVERPVNADETSAWTHSFIVPDDLYGEIEPLLSLLSNVVLMPCAAPMRSLMALGFYKKPSPDRRPMEWENAPAGDLVHRAKYWGSDVHFVDLVDAMVSVIQRHPWYARFSDIIVSIPGHTSESSFSERLAAAISRRVDRPLVAVRGRSHGRAAAKSEERADLDLSHEFVVDGDVSGKVVIVIDDVYMTGKTMNNVAVTLADAGARAVLGLVGARTMRAS